ncbi:hypothetical protein BP00DRAFT_33650 [Aspergillus indologenus CBS 114.80]|uniref:Uncharacterized protein n=1 Tax=Aspergillus indologenus CBS 114.80 TaxID=1450541 RepID=A0A2V5HTK3_9EURO|nr:hypothetical protein BP00DRAFT_33650 [Aspergillus indologenus CBS 114.80]
MAFCVYYMHGHSRNFFFLLFCWMLQRCDSACFSFLVLRLYCHHCRRRRLRSRLYRIKTLCFLSRSGSVELPRKTRPFSPCTAPLLLRYPKRPGALRGMIHATSI